MRGRKEEEVMKAVYWCVRAGKQLIFMFLSSILFKITTYMYLCAVSLVILHI